MAGIKEIRTKIKSVQNTRKITKAMEMVAASKMRKAQDRMRAGRPYAMKVRAIAAHLMQAHPDYTHPYMVESSETKAVGIIVVSTDKGLCGGLNTNILRLVLGSLRDFDEKGVSTQLTALGSKAAGTIARIGGKLVSQEIGLGDEPNLERLIGAVKVQLDDYMAGKVNAVYLASTRFINTMKQEPTFIRLLPLPTGLKDPFQVGDEGIENNEASTSQYGWDYIYEPDAKSVIDDLLHRYVEGLIYQAVAENMASEQSARMVAMKAASDNAKSVIGELELVYNKTRQAAITEEISEIVGGAAAV
ncbi:F0F1 ATP synthase subunit gamma [Alcaligenes endophyticus]|uniref:ATP synthase gamma chain n=1 Tax=Alcaligenes endophyticus TaxID=1929088 RepID=A0ABT8ELS6_9BURK|nr:F0F1 ATP synthase subunit gamma [Alcaligenes endophyticus]MCX5591187.1 F0F1 ATP synthase subunit gamma [Alcaligenes endophyticus]MDN4122235.1 F0F1 ATP synthase subunit gamma [Alcaligenes endophyticus]